MKLFRSIILIFSLLLTAELHAQFYVNGDDPGNMKWYQISTDQYNVIYPEGIDSLAQVYARNLERYKLPVSFSTTYYPGEKIFRKKKMPVVLHAYNAWSNGSVAWAPKRMDLYTIPTPYGPEAIPWSKMLAIHESRHVTQMQFGLNGYFRSGDVLFGEMFNILATILYTGTTYMEGDAVITETALTKAGRGRRADFLNYYMLAFDQGVKRNWYQWKEKSQKYYAPNYYALGYLTLGGFRFRWDCPDIMDQYYSMLEKQPYRIDGLNHKMKKISGLKFKDMFSEICDTVYTLWRNDAEDRKPYISGEQITRTPSRYTDYSDLVFANGKLYAIRKGFLDAGTLIEIGKDGKEKKITRFASEVGMLYHSPTTDRIFWSETVPDERWSLKSESKIRYMDLEKNSSKNNLTHEGLLYNPVPSPTENHIAVTEYTIQGRSRLAILNGKNGDREHTFQVPDSLQLIESAWIGNQLYASALSDNGYGIYKLDITLLNKLDNKGIYETKAHEEAQLTGSSWSISLPPQPAVIQNLSGIGKELLFTSDRSGVNEFYLLDPDTGKTRQITSTRYGVTQGSYSPDMKDFYYTAMTLNGNMIYRIAADSLISRPVVYEKLHKYPIAEKLTEQEKKMAEKNYWTDLKDEDIKVSRPERYRKLPHMLNVHSWAPVYVDVKNIMNLSYDHWYDLAALGVTGIFQNRLSTAYGNFGYSAHKDPYNKKAWRHSGHIKFTYSGLYPVLELEFDINDRAALQYRSITTSRNGEGPLGIRVYQTENPYIRTSLKAYIPWNFSSGGWYRGVIPQFTYSFSNDAFDSKAIVVSPDQQGPVFDGGFIRGKTDFGNNTMTHKFNVSLRAYDVMGTPNSCVYPKWGIGLEAGALFDLNKSDYFSHMGFAYAYGYLPGIVPQQGIKLSALYQHNFVMKNKKSHIGTPVVNVLPRGLQTRSDVLNDLSLVEKNLVKFTFDYGIPVYIGDVNIWHSFLSIKRMEINPHFDFMLAGKKQYLFSAGASVLFKLNTLVWIPWPCTLGVTYSYNDGSMFNRWKGDRELGHHYVGPVFSVSF